MTGLKIIIFLCAMTNIITGHLSEIITADCIQCLCEGATGCNMTAGCQSTYHGAYFCGPFHMSWQYWLDAGSPTIDDVQDPGHQDFQDCANQYFCARRTVENYLQKFIVSEEVDCNGDGVTDCIDFALANKRGGYNCHLKDNRATYYYGRFYECWNNTTTQEDNF